MLALDKYPPYMFLHQVADHIPETSKTFLYLWRERDDDHRIFVTRQDVVDKAFFSWTKFQNDLRKLAGNDLLEFTFADDVLVVTLSAADAELYEWEPG